MNHANSLHLPPVLAVRGCGDVSGAVENLLANAGFGSVGKDQVVGFHDIAGQFGGGDDGGGPAAEVEEKQRAMAASVALECDVGMQTQIQKVSENGNFWWRWK